MRFSLTREQQKPAGAVVIRAKDSTAIAYAWTECGKLCAKGFAGKADKASFYYSYRSEERRAAHIAEFFAQVKATEAARKTRKAERAAFVHTLKVGDMLYTSWGYDQTNVEFFQVTALIGATMVEAREVAQQSNETGFMSGNCAPVPGSFIGEAKRYRVLEGNELDIHKASFGRARPYKMHEVAPGLKVGQPLHWSSYA